MKLLIGYRVRWWSTTEHLWGEYLNNCTEAVYTPPPPLDLHTAMRVLTAAASGTATRFGYYKLIRVYRQTEPKGESYWVIRRRHPRKFTSKTEALNVILDGELFGGPFHEGREGWDVVRIDP